MPNEISSRDGLGSVKLQLCCWRNSNSVEQRFPNAYKRVGSTVYFGDGLWQQCHPQDCAGREVCFFPQLTSGSASLQCAPTIRSSFLKKQLTMTSVFRLWNRKWFPSILLTVPVVWGPLQRHLQASCTPRKLALAEVHYSPPVWGPLL